MDAAISHANECLKLGVDMETGVRGYQVTGDRRLLDPYLQARPAIAEEFDTLAGVLSDPAQRSRLAAVRNAHAEWSAFAAELIAARQNGGDYQSVATNVHGKQLFDVFRTRIGELIAAEERTQQERDAAFAATNAWVLRTRWVVLLLLGIGLAWYTSRQLSLVARLYQSSERNALREAERARQSAAEFGAMFEHALVGVFESDAATGRFLRCNPAYCDLLGYQESELVGQLSPLDVTHPDDRAAAAQRLKRVLSGEAEHYLADKRYVTKDRRLLWVTLAVALIRDSAGQPVRTVGVVVDQTARRAAEDELRAAQSELEHRVQARTAELATALSKAQEVDRLKSEFLATMSHELRTPLNSIIGFTEIVLAGIPGPINDEQKKQLQFVFGSARHLLHLINDLLDLARIESGRVEPALERLAPRAVIDEALETIRPLAERKGLRLTAELDLPPVISADRKMLFQVLLNLLGNAVKFTERGSVTLSARHTATQIEIAVRDTGIGIKPDQMGLLFEAFRQVDGSVQRRYEGTGLGLYLCKRIIDLLGGTIRAASEFGRGSTFTFTLPRC